MRQRFQHLSRTSGQKGGSRCKPYRWCNENMVSLARLHEYIWHTQCTTHTVNANNERRHGHPLSRLTVCAHSPRTDLIKVSRWIFAAYFMHGVLVCAVCFFFGGAKISTITVNKSVHTKWCGRHGLYSEQRQSKPPNVANMGNMRKET